MANTKVKIQCHHLYLNDAIHKEGTELQIDATVAKNILNGDKTAGREPRIQIIKAKRAVKPRSPKQVTTDAPE
ncbi:MAG: hypothetical protein HOE82_11960 [Gammaproteobacteria bacterium]|jgi:hypothetical protein|nr:hypothetical protein [Gammaproteobacteria bacterium]